MTHIKTVLAAAAFATAISGVMCAEAVAGSFFIGKAIFTASSGTCEWNPIVARPKVRFAPAKVNDNGDDTRLSFFYDWGGLGMTLSGGSFTSTFQAVTAYDVWAGAGDAGVVKIKVSKQTPAKILATTDNVVLQGQIRGGVAGTDCTLAFQMSLVRAAN